jgi:hypothetical protein
MKGFEAPKQLSSEEMAKIEKEKIEQKVWFDEPLDNLREKLEKEEQPEEYITRQLSIVKENIKKAKDVHDAFERGGGSPEVQEAKLKVRDLTEALEMHKKEEPDDKETIEHFEREIKLNQRVVDGERLVDVLDSMRSDEDKKRIKEAKKRHDQMKQL